MAKETQIGDLYQPRGVGWGGRWERGSKVQGLKKKKKCRDLEEQPHVQGAVAAWAQEG